MKNLVSLVACLTLTACASSAPLSKVQPFYIIPGTAIGDPCQSENMYLDTPRGLPRVCLNGRWAPLCDLAKADADLAAQCEAYGIK